MKVKTELWVMRFLCVVMTAIGLCSTLALVHQIKLYQSITYQNHNDK